MKEVQMIWICRECAKTYRVPLDTTNHTRTGGKLRLIAQTNTCPMCGQVRPLFKAEKAPEKKAV